MWATTALVVWVLFTYICGVANGDQGLSFSNPMILRLINICVMNSDMNPHNYINYGALLINFFFK
jgi:hypothetical protein